MGLTKLNSNLNYNQSQPDQPTMSADEMKKILDQAGIDIKEYINTILTEELDALIEAKVDKIQGKGLSEKDFTEEYETKLNGIASGANKYSLPTATSSTLGGVKTGSNITNSSGTISLTKSNVTTALGYTPPTTNTTYGVATTSANGLMSSSDKSKLDGIASGANKTTVSNSLTDTSTTNALSANQGRILNNGKAPTEHASTGTGYGLGSSDKYGHVKLINNLNASSYNAGEALSAKQGYELSNKISEVNQEAVMAYNSALNATANFKNFLNSGGTINGDLTLEGNFKNAYTYDHTTSEASNVYVSSSYNFRRSTSSSRRYKEDITENIEDRLNPEKLYDVPVVQFKYKENHLSKDDRRFGENVLGFIVEDLQEKFESAVDYNEDGTPEMWNYKIMIPAMLKLIQEQNERIKALENKEV